jgi:hypothetical protein
MAQDKYIGNGAESVEPEQFDRVDLALVESLRAIPPEPMASIAGEVMRGLAARERRLAIVRWTTVVAVASVAALGINAFGAGIFKFLYRLVLRGEAPSGLAVYSKLAQVLRQVFETLGFKFFRSALGYDLSPYSTQIWTVIIAGLTVVVLMMYLMGRWLGKPKEGRSWVLRRSLHNGLQVW